MNKNELINKIAKISIPINETENVYPMVAPGAANTEMIGGECNGN